MRRPRHTGRNAFFAEFLATAGVFDRWVDACTLHYSGPNASSPRDVLGTPMLDIGGASPLPADRQGVAIALRLVLGVRRLDALTAIHRTEVTGR